MLVLNALSNIITFHHNQPRTTLSGGGERQFVVANNIVKWMCFAFMIFGKCVLNNANCKCYSYFLHLLCQKPQRKCISKIFDYFFLKNNQMNFLNKRKRKEDNREDASLVQPSKKSRVISLVKKVGYGLRDKIAVAVQALTRRTYTQDVRSTLFTTPAGPLRTARYLMTPLEPFSVKKSSLEWRYVREKLW